MKIELTRQETMLLHDLLLKAKTNKMYEDKDGFIDKIIEKIMKDFN